MTAPRSRLVPLTVWLAAVLGVILMVGFALESTPLAVISRDVGRQEAAERAAAFLRTQGADPGAFTSTTSFRYDVNAQSYLLHEASRTALEARAAEDLNLSHWRVRFWRELDPEQWEVLISPASGRVIGFRYSQPAERPGASLEPAEAERIAREALPVAAELTRISAEAETQPARRDHRFVWEEPAREEGEARYRYTVRVEGDRVTWRDEAYRLPDSWQAEGAWHARRGALVATVGWMLTYALTILVGLTWLIEARRGRLRWAWARRLWLAVLAVGLLVMLNSIPLELAAYDVNQSLPLFLSERFLSYIGQLVTITGTIIFAGMVGEAIVWERSDGALALRAMLTRRGLVSRPVVQALLVGGLVGVAQLGAISAFYALGERWFGVWSPVTALYDDTLSTPFPPLYGLALGLLPAVGEELLFRLGGITVLERWTGRRWLAVVATAIIWAALHTTYAQRPFFIRLLELTIVGIVFGWLFLRYGVLAAMAAHFTYNASLYVPLFWGGSWWLFGFGLLAAAAVAVLLVPAVVRRLRGLPLESAEVLAEDLPPAREAVAPRRRPALWRRVHALIWWAGLVGVVISLGAARWFAPVLGREGTRSEALAAARAFTNPEAVAGLYPSVYPMADWVDMDLLYLRDELGREEARGALAAWGTERAWRVTWSGWDRLDSWTVELGPNFEIIAWSRRVPDDAPGATLSVAEAQGRAEAALRGRVDLSGYELIDSGTSERLARTDHRFTWQTREPVAGAAYRRINVIVLGDSVGVVAPELYTPPEYRREREQRSLADDLLQLGATGREGLLLALAVVGLVGALRGRVALGPWVRLGVVGGGLLISVALLRLSLGQLQDGPRLVLGVSWALIDGLLQGGEWVLAGLGAALLWRGLAAPLPSLEQQISVFGWSEVRLRREAVLTGLALAPLGVAFLALRGYWRAEGVWLGTEAMWSVLPVFDVLARALLSGLVAFVSLAGLVGLLGRWLPAWACAGLVAALWAATQIDMAQLGQWGLVGGAALVGGVIGPRVRGNLAGVALAAGLVRAGFGAYGLLASGVGWYQVQGVLIGVAMGLGLALLAGWSPVGRATLGAAAAGDHRGERG